MHPWTWLIILAYHQIHFTYGFLSVTDKYCNPGTILQNLRIFGASENDKVFRIQFGQELLFEMDFAFNSPPEVAEVHFHVFIPRFHEGQRTAVLSSVSCGFGISCPLSAGNHTLKSELLLEAENGTGACTSGNCERFPRFDYVGLRNASWWLTIDGSNNKNTPDFGKRVPTSYCRFKILLNVTEKAETAS